MKDNLFNFSEHVTDLVGVAIIIAIAIGVGLMMWIDYHKFLQEHLHHKFSFWEFIKREQIFIVLFLLLLFLMGGEIFLYNNM